MLNELKDLIKLHMISCSRALRKAVGAQLDKKWIAFYGTQRVITVFLTALHWSLS
jgi:hypothetical protein